MKELKIGLLTTLFSLSLLSCESADLIKTVKNNNTTNNTQPKNTVQPSVSPSATTTKLTGSFDLKKATEVVKNKCTYCHSATPNSASGYTIAPKKITFDTDKEIEDQMSTIKRVTYDEKSMPTGSITITEEERNLIGLFGSNNGQPTTSPALTIKNVPDIITKKCAYCHSATPDASSGYRVAPEGFIVDSLQQMQGRASKIKRSVASGQMPVGGITMTQEERNLVSQWADQQTVSGTASSGYGSYEDD